MSTRVSRVLAVGAFAVGTDANIVAGILPAVASGLSTSVATAGLLVSAFSLTYAVTAPLLPLLIGEVPRRVLLTLALLGFAVTNVLVALAPTPGVLMLSRVLAAVAAAAYMPTASAVAAGLASESARGRALGTVMAGMTAAQVLGVPVGALVGNTAGWRVSFGLVAGAVGAVSVGWMLPAVAAHARGGRFAEAPRSQFGDLAGPRPDGPRHDGRLRHAYVHRPRRRTAAGLRGSAVSVVLAGFGVASVVGSTVGGRMSDRLGGTRVAFAGIRGLTVALLGLAMTAQASAGAALLLLFVAVLGGQRLALPTGATAPAAVGRADRGHGPHGPQQLRHLLRGRCRRDRRTVVRSGGERVAGGGRGGPRPGPPHAADTRPPGTAPSGHQGRAPSTACSGSLTRGHRPPGAAPCGS